MIKRYWWIFVIVVIGIIGIGIYSCLPRYKVIQINRSLAWGNNPSTYTMSPAKIEVTNLKWGFPLKIPVKIINSGGNMNYIVVFQDPVVFDKGFSNADGNNDYSYSWDRSSIDIADNSKEVVNITVKKNSLFGGKGRIEKGIAISQNPSSDGSAVMSFSYIFEVLIK
jgi:hypothetical protein